jgi:hypothetical protein
VGIFAQIIAFYGFTNKKGWWGIEQKNAQKIWREAKKSVW